MAKQYVPIECQASIAWFKLSELVTRGERERAFSIFRLLTHALRDDAYAAQLKGDLWYAFHEYARARDAYQSAIAWYDVSQRFNQSAFLHERLIALDPNSLTLRIELITRFAGLSLIRKVALYTQEVLLLAREQNQWAECITLLEEINCPSAAHVIIQKSIQSFQRPHTTKEVSATL